MSRSELQAERIDGHFRILEKIGNLGPKREDGFLRASWSAEETLAMEHFKKSAEAEGMLASWDAVGNLFITTPGAGTEIVLTGSHLDSVPGGGNYDGAAGVVCGLEAILALKEDWSKLKRRLGLVVWRGEESACFTAVCKGSQAAFGLNDPSILGRKFQGITLEEAIRSQGFDPVPIANKTATLDPVKIDSIAALVELHIEQAKMLEIEKKAPRPRHEHPRHGPLPVRSHGGRRTTRAGPPWGRPTGRMRTSPWPICRPPSTVSEAKP